MQRIVANANSNSLLQVACTCHATLDGMLGLASIHGSSDQARSPLSILTVHATDCGKREQQFCCCPSLLTPWLILFEATPLWLPQEGVASKRMGQGLAGCLRWLAGCLRWLPSMDKTIARNGYVYAVANTLASIPMLAFRRRFLKARPKHGTRSPPEFGSRPRPSALGHPRDVCKIPPLPRRAKCARRASPPCSSASSSG